MTSKGQVTVPADIRHKLGLSTSDKLRVKEVKGQIVFEKDDYWSEFERLQKKYKNTVRKEVLRPLLFLR